MHNNEEYKSRVRLTIFSWLIHDNQTICGFRTWFWESLRIFEFWIKFEIHFVGQKIAEFHLCTVKGSVKGLKIGTFCELCILYAAYWYTKTILVFFSKVENFIFFWDKIHRSRKILFQITLFRDLKKFQFFSKSNFQFLIVYKINWSDFWNWYSVISEIDKWRK